MLFGCLSLVRGETLCEELTYHDRNQIDYGPVRVAEVRGVTLDPQGVAIPDVCIGVFAEGDHKLVAVAKTESRGRFALKHIMTGDYRLIASYEAFSPANAKIRIGRSRRRKDLIVRMRFPGLDTGSFVELK